MYKPPQSRTLSTKDGSLDSLNFWLRCGRRPNAIHIRKIVVWKTPVAAAAALRSDRPFEDDFELASSPNRFGLNLGHRLIARCSTVGERSAD
jgi:hypothetical protein